MDKVSEILTAFGAVLAVSLVDESDLLISLLFNGLISFLLEVGMRNDLPLPNLHRLNQREGG